MKTGIYARVSTNKQSEKEQIPEIIKQFELNIDDCIVFQEEVSAWRIDKEEKRFEFLRLKESIKKKEINKLYIWHIDRIFRNRKKTKEFFNFCYIHGVKIYSLQQRWLNDFQLLEDKLPDNFKFLAENMYNLLLDVYSQTAEDESRTKSERVKLKVTKDSEGITRSTNGKKWGRKSLPKKTINQVLKCHNEGKSIRWISKNVFYFDKNNNRKNLSVGSVHKTITENNAEKS